MMRRLTGMLLLAAAAVSLAAACAPAAGPAYADRILHVYTDELPEWAAYASNVMYESTEYWSERLPGTAFYVAESPQDADFVVKWVKEFGVEHVGYAFGSRFVEVGLGDSHCMDEWHPYSGRHVARIMKHEIGHILGRGHSDSPSDVMYPVALGKEYGLVETDLQFVENHAHFVPFCTSRDTTSFEYGVSTDDPVYGLDVYVVPGPSSLEDWSGGREFERYPRDSCFGTGYLSYGGLCESVSGGSGLLVVTGDTLSERLTTVTVKYREVFGGGAGAPAARAAQDGAPPQQPPPQRQQPQQPPPQLGGTSPAAGPPAMVSIPRGTSAPGCEERGACYEPMRISAGPGESVTWTNDDTAAHTVTGGAADGGPDGTFDSGLLLPGGSFTHRFDDEGEHAYYCIVHPWAAGYVHIGHGGSGGRSSGSTGMGTVAVDGDSYAAGRGETVYATVSGMLYDSKPGDRVAVTVTRPDGSTDGGILPLTDNGEFSMPVVIDSASPAGPYEVLATFGDSIIGTAAFEVTGSQPAAAAARAGAPPAAERQPLPEAAPPAPPLPPPAAPPRPPPPEPRPPPPEPAPGGGGPQPPEEGTGARDGHGLSGPPAAPDGAYVDEDYGFSIVPPAGWEIESPATVGNRHLLWAASAEPGGEEFLATLFVDYLGATSPDAQLDLMVQLVESGSSLDGYMDTVKASMLEGDELIRVKVTGTSVERFQDGIALVIELVGYSTSLRETVKFSYGGFMTAEDTFVMGYAATNDGYDLHGEELERAAATFRIGGVPQPAGPAQPPGGLPVQGGDPSAGLPDPSDHTASDGGLPADGQAPPPATADGSAPPRCGEGTVRDKDGVCQISEQGGRPGDASGAGGGCLVATASYGSEMAPQVQMLRELRHAFMQETQSGAEFVGWFNGAYYALSPPIADMERQIPLFREAVRVTIAPLIASLGLLQYADAGSWHEVVAYGTALVIINACAYIGAPAALAAAVVSVRRRRRRRLQVRARSGRPCRLPNRLRACDRANGGL